MYWSLRENTSKARETMTYEFQLDGSTYYVECEKHGYRTRFYATRTRHYGAASMQGVKIDRLGYIGSYFPGNKTVRFKFTCGPYDGADYSSSCRGQKTGAKTLIIAFMEMYNLVWSDCSEVR